VIDMATTRIKPNCEADAYQAGAYPAFVFKFLRAKWAQLQVKRKIFDKNWSQPEYKLKPLFAY